MSSPYAEANRTYDHLARVGQAANRFNWYHMLSAICVCGRVFTVRGFTPEECATAMAQKCINHIRLLYNNLDVWDDDDLAHYRRITIMARLNTAHILFARTTHNRQVTLRPVATFSDPKEAKSFAAFLKLAYRAGDDASVKTLDAGAHRDESGALVPDPKFSVVAVPHAPIPAFADDDDDTGKPA
jgi:hypothetical protein